MKQTRKVTMAGLLTAMGVVASTFYIPIGAAKCFPIQHFINVLAAVLLGPVYGVSMAFTTSFLRNLMGTGSLLAFPGSMCGALLAGLCYKYGKNYLSAWIGEIIGTGVIGALLAYPVAAIFLSKTGAIYGFVIPFMVSSFAGASLSLLFLTTLQKTGILNYGMTKGDRYEEV